MRFDFTEAETDLLRLAMQGRVFLMRQLIERSSRSDRVAQLLADMTANEALLERLTDAVRASDREIKAERRGEIIPLPIQKNP